MRGAVGLVSLIAACGRFGFQPDDRLGHDASVAIADVAPPDAAPTALAFVQATGSGNAPGTVISDSFAQPVAIDHTLIVAVDFDIMGALANVTFSDTLGTAFKTVIDDATAAGYLQLVAIGTTTASGVDRVTVTLDRTSASFLEFHILDYAGRSTLDASSSIAGMTSTVASPPITTSGEDELLFGYCVYHTGLGEPGAGFTVRDMTEGDYAEDRMLATPGTYTTTATMTTTGTWNMSAVALRSR